MKVKVKYVTSVNGVYYFRINVPQSLRSALGISELKRSLHTEDLHEASYMTTLLIPKLMQLFYKIEEQSMLKEKATDTIRKFFEEELETRRHKRLKAIYPNAETKAREKQELRENLEEMRVDGHTNNLLVFSKVADHLIKTNKLAIEKDSSDYMLFCEELLTGFFNLTKEEINMVGGYYGMTLDDIIPPKQQAESTFVQTPIPNDPAYSISVLFERFIDEKMHTQQWQEGNKTTFVMLKELLVEVFGDVDIRSLTHQKLLDFRDDILSKLPPNRHKKPEYREKTYTAILKMKNVKTISLTTLNNHLTKYGTFFRWTNKHKFISENIAEGLGLDTPDRDDEKRDIYTRNNLLKILENIKEFRSGKPERYWIPIIALLSGMRQNEIAQLYISDIQKLEGILCFNLQKENPDQKLKTKAARRIVPVHPDLIELGFDEYIDQLKKKHLTRLWPNLKAGRDGFGHCFQRWYGKFNRRKITTDEKQVFHSFRHTFIDNLKQQDVNEIIISELVGHANKSITTGRYGKRYEPKKLLDAMLKLEFGFNIVEILAGEQTNTTSGDIIE